MCVGACVGACVGVGVYCVANDTSRCADAGETARDGDTFRCIILEPYVADEF